MSTTSPPRLTLVSAVHDDARWLDAFVATVEEQTLSFDDLQVVMVDCGSGDGSLARLQSWAAARPDQVVVLSRPGSSVGAARNAGLALAEAPLVSFPRACDGFEPDYLTTVLAFAATAPDAALISLSRASVDDEGRDRLDYHPLQMFHRGDRVLDIERTPEVIAGDPTSTFFSTTLLRSSDVTFAELWSGAPDPFDLAWRLMLRSANTRVGLVSSAKYLQRRSVVVAGRPDSMTAPAGEDPTLEMLRTSYLGTLEEATTRLGEPPEWLRHQMVYGLAHFYVTNDARPPIGVPIEKAERETFHEVVGSILAQLDVDDTVPHAMSRIRRITRLAMQHGYQHERWVEPEVLMDELDDEQKLVRFSYFHTGAVPTEEFRSDGEPISPVHAKTRELYFTGRHLLSHRIAWLPFGGMMEARLDGRSADLALEAPSFPRHRVTQSVAGWALRPNSSRVLGPAAKAIPPVAKSRRGRLAQFLADRPRYRRKYADAWVLMDRLHDAGDNGEAMFKHLRAKQPDINAWFVLEKDSPHWERLAREGFEDRMVAHGTVEWRVLMMHCRHLLSSHADFAVTRPAAIEDIRILDWKFTFLQHGVIMFDLSNWLNQKELDVLVTSTEGEFHSIAGEGSQYLVTTREAVLSGMPRWDRLLELSEGYRDRARDLILVAPTWRKWLLPPLVPGSQKRPLDLSALETDFFRSWKAFLTDERLEKLAADHGLSVGFLPHPNLQPLLAHLELPARVQALTYADNNVQELIARARLMVTDYSSIAFDAAYIHRPVTYFQFDTEHMLEGSHVGSRGYFDFERDGFGPVATTLDDVIREVQNLIEAGDAPSPEYTARIEQTFPDRDGNCSARVVEAVRRSTRRVDAGSVVPTPAASRAWR